MHELVMSLVRSYRRNGPIFRLGGSDRGPWVLAGLEANLLLARSGDRLFSSGDFYGHFVKELGADNFVVAMDGPPHREMRRVMRPAFAGEAIDRYLPSIGGMTRDLARSWCPGGRVDAVETFRRLITDQTSLAMTGQAAGDHFESVSAFFETVVSATLGRYAPRALADPQYHAARQRVFGLLRDIVAAHAADGTRPQPDYIDLLLAARDEGGPLRQDHDLLAAGLVPFFAGIDTVAYTCCFLLHALLRDAHLRRRVVAEIDGGFASGIPDLATLGRMQLLRHATMEALRLYPVAPPAIRTVVENFEFAGQMVEAGDMVMIATPVTHFLPELFADPLRFDPDRFADPRHEHRRPGAFIPFFKGPHTCIGATLGEFQVMLTVGTLLRHVSLELERPDAELELVADPILRPRGYGARVVAVRDVAPTHV